VRRSVYCTVSFSVCSRRRTELLIIYHLRKSSPRDAVKPTSAHNALTTIIEDGEQLEIVRDNMPFGDVGKGEFGTYFIGYARSPRRIEQMLENMFVGRPPGNYDRLLDFSRAVTGTLFFVPSATFLENVATGEAAPIDCWPDLKRA
jgi:putative iron-dependent peroxidase